MPLVVDEPVVSVIPRTVLLVPIAFRLTTFTPADETLSVVAGAPVFIAGNGNESAGTDTPEIAASVAVASWPISF